MVRVEGDDVRSFSELNIAVNLFVQLKGRHELFVRLVIKMGSLYMFELRLGTGS